jgi:hypothetical protein
VLGDDRRDVAILAFRLIHAVLQHQRDVRFGPNEGEFALVVIDVAGLGVAISRRAIAHEFRDDIADTRVGRQIRLAFRPDANLGAAVAAKYGPVLNERDRETQSRGRDRGGRSGDSTADNHQVVVASIGRFAGPAKQFATKCG